MGGIFTNSLIIVSDINICQPNIQYKIASIYVGSYPNVPVTRSYIMHCHVLPLPFGVILLRYALVATPGCKALRTIWRNLKTKLNELLG